jgi:hypothetical protein
LQQTRSASCSLDASVGLLLLDNAGAKPLLDGGEFHLTLGNAHDKRLDFRRPDVGR